MPTKKTSPKEVEPVVAELSLIEIAEARRDFLLQLRETLTTEGINDISKLDVLLGEVNQRIVELS